MLNFTVMGLASWTGSFVLLIFHAISTMTDTGRFWRDLTLADLGPFNLLGDFSFWGIENAFSYMMHLPLFAVLFSVGILLFIINGFCRIK